MTNVLRSGGAFFTEKYRKNITPLQEVIISEYLKVLMEDKCNLEFYIEVNRSRSGKLTNPRNEVFKMFTRNYLNNQYKKNQPIHIVPISINYEKVYESFSFPFELLGFFIHLLINLIS